MNDSLNVIYQYIFCKLCKMFWNKKSRFNISMFYAFNENLLIEVRYISLINSHLYKSSSVKNVKYHSKTI